MTNYIYHDIGDEITQLFIKQHEPYYGYWAESEAKALDTVSTYLSPRVAVRSSAQALDIGCGEGRLLPWLSKFASRITAVEPDERRLSIAQLAHNDIPDTNADFIVGDFSSLAKVQYDVVLCSHILQHIEDPTAALQQMYNLTKIGGFLVVSYCKQTVADGDIGEYFFDTIQDNKVVSDPISKEEFNQYIKTGTTEGLPVHHIDPIWLHKQAKTTGWEPKLAWSFHVIEDDQHKAQDEWVNQSEPRALDYGRDIIEIWQKL